MTLQFEELGLPKVSYSEDNDPLYLFLEGNIEMRSNVLLNHPDVTGFIYLNDDIVTKAFLPKRVVNFKKTPDKRNTIVAVSGDTEDFTPFAVPEHDLLSDTFHFTNCENLNPKTPSISAGRYLKDNQAQLPNLPSEFDTDAKIRKLKIVSFPLILPLIKGYDLIQGDVNDSQVGEACHDSHDLYEEWLFLHSRKYVVTSVFSTDELQCPIPANACDIVTSFEEIPLKALFKSNLGPSSPFAIIKKEIENFIIVNKKEEQKVASVPEIIDVQSLKNPPSTSSSSEGSIANERLTAFLQILFAVPQYGRGGELLSLEPAELSDDIQEILTSSSKSSEQARMVNDGIRVLSDDISRERSYLSRASKFPFLSNTLLTYALQAHFHSEAIDVDLESLKKAFSILSLLAPPSNQSDEYKGYVAASKNNDVDRMLDQPDDKRAAVRKEVFIKGRQHSISDVVSFIANIVVFARFFVKLPHDLCSNVPLVIDMLLEIADILSSSAYQEFDERFRKVAPYMYHTLVVYVFNIFSKIIKAAKNPHIVRKLKIENIIDPKEIKLARTIFDSFIDQLNLCSATSSLQLLFAQPASSYNFFFPQMNDKKRANLDKDKSQEPQPKKSKFGSIINTTGKRIFFPKGLEKKYCAEYLDVNKVCKHGDKCTFTHAVFPSGFTANDRLLMEKHIEETEGLSVKDKNVSMK